MNIGLFTDSYYPEINGVATSVLTLKIELELLGHTVYVFTTTSPGSPEHEHNVFRVPSLPCILITERRIGLFYQPKLAALIKKLNLDLIHTHTEFSLGIFGRIMARELGIPMVHTYHTIYEDYTHYVTNIRTIDKRAKSFARIFTRVCCNHVEQVIVPTEKVKNLLLQYNVNRAITVVATGVNLRKFDTSTIPSSVKDDIRNEVGLKSNEKVILYIGRVSKEKNISEIIDTMAEYTKSHDDVKFIIVGNGPDMDNLVKQVKRLDLEEKVIFLGAKPWDQIANYYNIGDVFVSGSTSETQGLTYIEAMASGLPVVARDDSCLDEILEQGYNGYRFTNREELIKGLDLILYDNQNYPYGEHAKGMMDKYSTESFAKNIVTVYEDVMKRKFVEIKQIENESKKIVKFFLL